MYVLGCEITIGSYTFNEIANVTINRSSRLISDTAVIEMPLRAIFENKQYETFEKKIKRGDSVTIKLAYDGNLNTEFEGYVKEVIAKNKTIIECEDSMYLLRQPLQNKMFKNEKFENIVEYIVKGTGLEANTSTLPEYKLTEFLIKDLSRYQALKKLKDDYGFLVY